MDSNIRKYFAYVCVVDCGSFTQAAELLHYSQSAVSRMIGDLEQEWGITLLERGRSGVRVTSEGQRILPYVEELCREYEKLQMQVDEINGLQSGLIRIGTFSSAATHWLPNMIRKFRQQYPNIQYEILLGDYGEIEQWVLEGRVDCGFLLLPVSPELEAEFLERDKLLAVLPVDHELAGCERFPAEALTRYPFILLQKGGRTEVSQIFEEHGLPLEASYITVDDYAIMSMVEKGLGISVLPQLVLRRCAYNIVLKELDSPAYREICLAWRRNKPLSPAVKRLLEFLPDRNDPESNSAL